MSTPIHDPEPAYIEDVTRLAQYFFTRATWRWRNHYFPAVVAAADLMEVHWVGQLAQCWVETGGGTHEYRPGVPGAVRPDQHNLCGLKTRHADGDETADFQSFASPFAGAVAQALHLRRYAGLEEHPLQLLDPRWVLVTPGTAQTFEALSGSWATDPDYGPKIEWQIEEWMDLLQVRSSGVYDLSLGVTPLWMPLEVTAEGNDSPA